MHHRVDGGRPLRKAMRVAGMTLQDVAARTKEIDPDGRGISPQLVGFYTSKGSSARETASDFTAQLITKAIGGNAGEYFSPTDD